MSADAEVECDAPRARRCCWVLVNGNPCEARGIHEIHWAVTMRGDFIPHWKFVDPTP